MWVCRWPLVRCLWASDRLAQLKGAAAGPCHSACCVFAVLSCSCSSSYQALWFLGTLGRDLYVCTYMCICRIPAYLSGTVQIYFPSLILLPSSAFVYVSVREIAEGGVRVAGYVYMKIRGSSCEMGVSFNSKHTSKTKPYKAKQTQTSKGAMD